MNPDITNYNLGYKGGLPKYPRWMHMCFRAEEVSQQIVDTVDMAQEKMSVLAQVLRCH